MDYIEDDNSIFSSNSSDLFLSNSTFDNNNTIYNNNNSSNISNNSNISFNFSEYIVPPEKEGSPFAACASIVFKSDLKVKKISTVARNDFK
jgi:hypothetical protein